MQDILIRFFDIFFSLIALIVLSPIMLIIAIILKIFYNEVIYKQKRVGKDGRLFTVYKFVTMIKNSENMGTKTITIKNDWRITPFGKFLRKTKLNELPQLINILKGDMSIIGPRPQDEDGFNAFDKEEQEILKKDKPGLSGIGSIIFRNEEDLLERIKEEYRISFYKNIIAPYKGKVEAWYIKNKSTFLYFYLIFLTIIVVIFPNFKVNFWEKFKNFPFPPEELKSYL